jgi:hypothetical protein
LLLKKAIPTSKKKPLLFFTQFLPCSIRWLGERTILKKKYSPRKTVKRDRFMASTYYLPRDKNLLFAFCERVSNKEGLLLPTLNKAGRRSGPPWQSEA